MRLLKFIAKYINYLFARQYCTKSRIPGFVIFNHILFC